jgi:hypothetical protein
MAKHFRPGEKQSLVNKNGITVYPIPLAVAGGIAYQFHIRVEKIGANGDPIVLQSKEPNKRYPAKASNTEPSVWEKMEQIYDYYYGKLSQNR